MSRLPEAKDVELEPWLNVEHTLKIDSLTYLRLQSFLRPRFIFAQEHTPYSDEEYERYVEATHSYNKEVEQLRKPLQCAWKRDPWECWLEVLEKQRNE